MQRIHCPNCAKPVGFTNVFVAGLPSRIVCGFCSSPVPLKFTPFVLYPLLTLALVFCLMVGWFLGNMLISADILPIRDGKIRIGVFIIAALVFETLLTLVLLYCFQVNSAHFRRKKIQRRPAQPVAFQRIDPKLSASAKNTVQTELQLSTQECQTFANVVQVLSHDTNVQEIVDDYAKITTFFIENGTTGLYEFVESEFDLDSAQYFVDFEFDQHALPYIYLITFECVLARRTLLCELDVKCHYNSTEMLFALDCLLVAQAQPKVTEQERTLLNNALSPLDDMSQAVFELIHQHLELIVKQRNKRILWLDKNSDSLVFLLVSADCREALAGQNLNKEVRFY